MAGMQENRSKCKEDEEEDAVGESGMEKGVPLAEASYLRPRSP